VTELVLILTTVPPGGEAGLGETIARTLVEERLAACVNVQAPMISVYRWKGVVERDSECQLLIKTVRQRTHQVRARIRDLHPYELPEWIVLTADAGREYLDWVRAETDGSDTSRTR
jgi:periplasmic divalent cation tolerance protein